ncbi:MAG: hypothetical protein JXR83_11890 [Deltaproteobacteria bacterium]|nr:hypothetical protein [Deltaproteobacteria bacterium]
MALAALAQAVIALTMAAVAQPTSDRAEDAALQRARAAFIELRYNEAEAAYLEALAKGGNQAAALSEIHLRLGIIAASSNRTDEAVDLFTRMLLIDPKASVPADVSPKVQRPFIDAQANFSKLQPCFLEHAPVQHWPATGGLELRVRWDTDSLGMAQGVWLMRRSADNPTYRVAEQRERGEVLFTVNRNEVPEPAVLEYYLELRDANGNTLRNTGTAATPLRVAEQTAEVAAVEQEAAPGEAPWPWIIAGSAALLLVGAGAAAAIAYAVIPPEPPDFGKIEHQIGQSW